MLYGDSNADATASKDDLSRSLGQPTFSDGSSGKAEPSHWCMIIRENGVMEVRASTREASAITQLHLLHFLVHLLFRADLPAARVAPGLPGEELSGGPESAGGQLVGPVRHAGGREEGGGDAARRDPPRQGGGAGVARLQPQQAIPAGEIFYSSHKSTEEGWIVLVALLIVFMLFGFSSGHWKYCSHKIPCSQTDFCFLLKQTNIGYPWKIIIRGLVRKVTVQNKSLC